MAIEDLPVAGADVKPQRLPSGRTVLTQAIEGDETVEIRSPDGEMEIRITLTETGPVLSLRGAKLQMEAADSFAVKCKKFAVDAEESATINTQGTMAVNGGEMRVRTVEDVHLNGAFIRLNCKDSLPPEEEPGEAAT